MSEIKTNQIQAHQVTVANQQAYATAQMKANSPKTLNDEFVSQHKKNGLFERLYNVLKNITGIGTGSKKAQKAIEQAERGEISEEQARETIKKYRNSQASSEQAFGDVLSIGASAGTFFGLRKMLKTKCAEAVINEKYYTSMSNDITKVFKNLNETLVNLSKSKTKMALLLAGSAALVGGFVKKWALKFNRVGSKEFKYSKDDFNGAKTPYDEAAYKIEKKAKKKERRRANFRNFASGALNGLMMPLTVLGSVFVGIPAYFVGNSLNRYFVGNHEERNKNFKSYVENLKNDGIAHAALIAATAVPMVKKGQFAKVFDANIKKATDKLVNAELKASGYEGATVYKELEAILMSSKSVNEIAYGSKLSVQEQIKALTKENIFAVKFKQISRDGSILAKELRENCPPSRTLEQAQSYITKNLGNGYEVSKLLGVGTVAETYLAKSPEGKEVCIKILKDGINKEKILADKQKFVDIVKNMSGKTAEEKQYLLKNVDDLSDGILKEVDFVNEMEAAKKLAEHTNIAHVVKPIEVKNGIYVMEKAEGISLASLVELNAAKNYKAVLENPTLVNEAFEPPKGSRLYDLLKDVTNKEDKIKIIDEYIKRIESRTPQFGDISLTRNDMLALINEYQKVLIEQFNKVEKGGKVLHADIHPGNIFIDVQALKNRKSDAMSNIQGQLGKAKSNKIFTLIDTGNTVTMDVEQSLRSINLTSYINNGNVKDISAYLLDGASLGGKTREEALALMEKELKKMFFDAETKLERVTNESLVNTASNIMRKYGITPSDTQLSLNKARQSAANSLEELVESMCMIALKDVKTPMDMFKLLGSMGKDALLVRNQYKSMQGAQEKFNLLQLSAEQRLKQMKNPNMLAKNSEEYLTYKLKQAKKEVFKAPDLG